MALTAPNDQTYTMGRPISALTLPAATGGTGTLTYTLTGPSDAALNVAVPGLTFTTTTRVLSGTPTTAATTALTYTVTDERGSTASDTFTLTVAAQVAVTAPNDQTYTMGRPITALTLPAATGGTGTLTYTLTGPSDAALNVAVPGLTFDPLSRALSGTPTTSATIPLTYTVTDERGSTRLGYLQHHRGGRRGRERSDRSDLYDRPDDHRLNPAGGHRRYRYADLHPAGRQR